MNDFQKFFEANKKLWNDKTGVHEHSDFYENQAFLAGKNTLNAIEMDALGDVRGKKLLHLQCHFGQDSLSWARLGAQVTGVDFSEKAIRLARAQARQLGIKARFIESNIFDLPQNLKGKFDIVFTSYGTICWLPDLRPWAAIVRQFLKKGGLFYIVDFHPALYMFDFETQELKYDYFNPGDPIVEDIAGTYAERYAEIGGKEYSWVHSLEEVVMPLIREGLQLRELKEFPWSPYKCFPHMRQLPNGMYRYGDFPAAVAHLFSIKMKG